MILLFFVLRDWGRLSPAISNTGDTELANIDDADLATYRTQLEQELAAEDPIFLSGKGVEALGEAKGSTFQSLAPLGVGEELKPRDEAGTQQTPSRPPQETEAN